MYLRNKNIKNAHYCNLLIIIMLKVFKEKLLVSFSGHNVTDQTCSLQTGAVRYGTPSAGVSQDSTSGKGTTLSVYPTKCAPWGTVRRITVSMVLLTLEKVDYFIGRLYLRHVQSSLSIFVLVSISVLYFAGDCEDCHKRNMYSDRADTVQRCQVLRK